MTQVDYRDLEDLLERIRRDDGEDVAERLLAIGRETAPLLKEPWRSTDHGDLLYHDRGLPA